MTPSKLYDLCDSFLGATDGQAPVGHDAPPSFKAQSDQADLKAMAGIAAWEQPHGAEGDENLKKLLAAAKRLAEQGLPMKEQLCSTAAAIRKHLKENYSISQ